MRGQFDGRIKNSGLQESSIKLISDDPEGLVALAQEYFSIASPNPDRIGCMAPGRMAEVIGCGELRVDDWYSHMYECSECFREYRSQPPHLRTLLKSEAGKIIMYEFLIDLDFFIPTHKLTEDIVLQNRHLARQDFKDARREALESEAFEHRFREQESDHPPADSPKGQQRFIDRCIELFRGEAQDDYERVGRIAKQNQLAIAETLYGYLAVLARRTEALKGEPYNIWLTIPQGMGNRLGLARAVEHLRPSDFEGGKYRLDNEQLFDDHSQMLLTELTNEFHRWLSEQHNGIYDRAPWGVMYLGDSNHLVIKAASRERKRRTRPYEGEAHYGPSTGFERRIRE